MLFTNVDIALSSTRWPLQGAYAVWCQLLFGRSLLRRLRVAAAARPGNTSGSVAHLQSKRLTCVRPLPGCLSHPPSRSEELTSELQSPCNLVCRLLLEKKKKKRKQVSVNNFDIVPVLVTTRALQ